MKRLILIGLFTLAILAIAQFAKPNPVMSEPPQTRGQSKPHDPAWDSMIARLRQEESNTMPMMMLALLQSSLRIDGTIQLWQLITVIGGGILTGVIFGINLKNEMKSHVATDAIQFKQVSESHEKIVSACDEINDRLRAIEIHLGGHAERDDRSHETTRHRNVSHEGGNR